MALDDDRRQELRSFLMQCRSRLRPIDVGLPRTERRRVPGLRRSEVAELVGVSADWYRWFESGRSVRVSPRFVARLAGALRLDPLEQRTLYRLALIEVYEADATVRNLDRSPFAEHVSVQTEPTRRSLLCSIDSSADIEGAAREFALARDGFLTGSVTLPASSNLRARVVNSWRRSQSIGVNVSRREAAIAFGSDDALSEARAANQSLLAVAEPALAQLMQLLSDSGYALAVADSQGRVLTVTGDRDICRRLSRYGFEAGSDWAEPSAGTNGLGTSLTDGRPIQLMAAEHFCDGWQGLTCTAAPIYDPATNEIIGALDITSDFRLVRPQLVRLVAESVLEIQENLAVHYPSRARAPIYHPRGANRRGS